MNSTVRTATFGQITESGDAAAILRLLVAHRVECGCALSRDAIYEAGTGDRRDHAFDCATDRNLLDAMILAATGSA